MTSKEKQSFGFRGQRVSRVEESRERLAPDFSNANAFGSPTPGGPSVVQGSTPGGPEMDPSIEGMEGVEPFNTQPSVVLATPVSSDVKRKTFAPPQAVGPVVDSIGVDQPTSALPSVSPGSHLFAEVPEPFKIAEPVFPSTSMNVDEPTDSLMPIATEFEEIEVAAQDPSVETNKAVMFSNNTDFVLSPAMKLGDASPVRNSPGFEEVLNTPIIPAKTFASLIGKAVDPDVELLSISSADENYVTPPQTLTTKRRRSTPDDKRLIQVVRPGDRPSIGDLGSPDVGERFKPKDVTKRRRANSTPDRLDTERSRRLKVGELDAKNQQLRDLELQLKLWAQECDVTAWLWKGLTRAFLLADKSLRIRFYLAFPALDAADVATLSELSDVLQDKWPETIMQKIDQVWRGTQVEIPDAGWCVSNSDTPFQEADAFRHSKDLEKHQVFGTPFWLNGDTDAYSPFMAIVPDMTVPPAWTTRKRLFFWIASFHLNRENYDLEVLERVVSFHCGRGPAKDFKNRRIVDKHPLRIIFMNTTEETRALFWESHVNATVGKCRQRVRGFVCVCFVLLAFSR